MKPVERNYDRAKDLVKAGYRAVCVAIETSRCSWNLPVMYKYHARGINVMPAAAKIDSAKMPNTVSAITTREEPTSLGSAPTALPPPSLDLCIAPPVLYV